MRYTHIVFDVDGTLIDTENAVLSSLRDVIKEISKRDTQLDELRFALGITGDKALTELGMEDVGYANSLWQKYFSRYAKDITVFDGIREVLELLISQSRFLGIITSKTKNEYQNDFIPFGIAHYFNIVIFADDTINHKPHSEPMLKFLQETKADPKKTLYIGDTVYDMECARGAGVDFALALWGCKKPEGIKADYYLANPGETGALTRPASANAFGRQAACPGALPPNPHM